MKGANAVIDDGLDWDCIPHDPFGFFKLTRPIDQLQLRSQYHAAIKTYKPHKAPIEFQKIRAAYEQACRLAEIRERFGEQANSTLFDSARADIPQTFVLDSKPARTEWAQAHQKPDDETSPVVARQRLLEALQSSPIETIVDDLRHKSGKSTWEYIALATLLEADGDDEFGFASTLMEALAAHPQSQAVDRKSVV